MSMKQLENVIQSYMAIKKVSHEEAWEVIVTAMADYDDRIRSYGAANIKEIEIR